MLRVIEDIIGAEIRVLRTGKIAGILGDPIIDPHTLKIEALYCSSHTGRGGQLVIFTSDIKSVGPNDVIIDDDTEQILEMNDELVRLREIIDLQFQLLSKAVRTASGQKIGKVRGYSIDDEDFKIIKLHVTPGIIKILTNADRLIDRQQIIEVNDEEIVVKDTTIPLGDRRKIKTALPAP